MNYKITFQKADKIYCTNIVVADNKEDAMNHYKKYKINGIAEATEQDLEEAERKGMPFIDLSPKLKEDELEL